MNIPTMETLKQTIERAISGMDMDGKSIIKLLKYEGCPIEICDELVDKQFSVTTYIDNMQYIPPKR